MMNRRGFLTTLAAAAGGLLLDPERLLWTPGAKTIFIPPRPGLFRTGLPEIRWRRLEPDGRLTPVANALIDEALKSIKTVWTWEAGVYIRDDRILFSGPGLSSVEHFRRRLP